jgi:hypothetical protein
LFHYHYVAIILHALAYEIYGKNLDKRYKDMLKQKIENIPKTMIFSKTFLPLNLRADNTNLTQKQIEKKLDTSEVMAEKPF